MGDRATSRTLLERVRRNDQEAWYRLLYLYAPLVHYWCQTWGVTGADSDDIRQEVFQSVATGLEGFRHDHPGATFRGWLRTITHRKFLDHCRKRERQTGAAGGTDFHRQLAAVPAPDELPDEDPPEEVKQLHHRALELVRGEFEEKTWQAFWRCAVDGRPPADVGTDLEMTPAAVRQAKSRVLRRLKEELGDLLG